VSFCPEVASLAIALSAPPGAVPGTLNEQVKAPAPVVVTVAPESVPTEHDVGVTALPAKAIVTPVPGAYPVPVPVTVLPTRPPAGAKLNEGLVNVMTPLTAPTPVTVAFA